MADVRQNRQTGEGGFRDPPGFVVESHGHVIAFHPSGAERLAALLALIDGAQTSLGLSFYIFARDASGVLVRDALTAAALRGVRVSVILDGFGAEADADFFAEMIAAGGRFASFLGRWSRRALIRNHQKIVIADGKHAMLGGFNVADDYFAVPGPESWTDLGFTITGPVVERITAWFAELESWTANDKAQLLALSRRVRAFKPGAEPVRLLIGGPSRRLSGWARTISADLERARRVDMLMAYFAPGRRLRKRLRKVASRGRLRLLLAGRSDNGATIGAARALYTGLLRCGAHIAEFDAAKLHSKVIVLDDVTYIGSANLDMRSLYVNLEIMLRIEDAALAQRMRAFIAAHQPGAQQITAKDHAARASWLNRARWWASWFLVSVVDYTVTRRLNLGL